VTVTKVEIRGVELAVEDIDPTGGSTKPPLVWTHGLTSSMADEDDSGVFDWSPVMAAGRRVIRYDVRGHGGSGFTPGPRAYEWDELAVDLIGLLDRLGIERAAIGGASLGSAVSLHLATRAAERVGALVLAIPPTAWSTRPDQARRYSAAVRLIEERGLGAYIAACRMQPQPSVFTGWLDGLWERLYRSWENRADECRRRFPDIFLGASTTTLPPDDALGRIDSPTLILAWTGDTGHPVSTATRLAELVPSAELVVADDAAAVAEWPDRVAAFLDEHL
jgi:pimeloyl-ACP methyl ester carboxylesterase